MAYRFQDLQGNWRMRFDDGTTSNPIDPSSLNVRERDSTIEVKDLNSNFRSEYGVDSAFGSSNAALGGAASSRADALKAAIVEKQMSDSRISQFQSEFQPLASMANTQGALIEKVAANPAADAEMRAGAFQALYPGMKVDVDHNGNLSFSAKSSDLGFTYPDKQKLKDQSLKQGDPKAEGSLAEGAAKMRDFMAAVRQARTPEEVSSIMSDAAMLQHQLIEGRKGLYESELAAASPIARLTKDLERSRLLDSQFRIQQAGMGLDLGGDSSETLEIQRQLIVAQQMNEQNVSDRLKSDTELSNLTATYKALEAMSQHHLGETITAPTLVNPSVVANLASVYNDGGEPATPQQLAELEKRIANKDPSATLLADFSKMEAPEALMSARALTKHDAEIAARTFDKMSGIPSLFKDIRGDVENFDSFVKERGIELDKASQDILAVPSSAQYKVMDKAGREEALRQVEQLKIDLVLGAYKDKRDSDWTKDIVKSAAVPPNEDAARYWKDAISSLEKTKLKELLDSNASSPFALKETNDQRAARLAKIKASPSDYIKISIAEVIQQMGTQMSQDDKYPSDVERLLAVESVGKLMAEWLQPQIDAAPASNTLGKVNSPSGEQVLALLATSITTASVRKRQERQYTDSFYGRGPL